MDFRPLEASITRFVSALSVLTSLLGACTTAPTPVPPAVAKSMPPQATIELRHDGHGDACEAWVTEELAIDVSSLLERSAGTVVVRLGDERIRLETP